MILSDSMVKGLNEYSLIKNDIVKVESFSGYTTEDTLYIAKPTAWRKPEATTIHAGTNDIMRDINTMKNNKQIVKSVRDCSENTQVLLPGIINREDGNYTDKIAEINLRMASYK